MFNIFIKSIFIYFFIIFNFNIKAIIIDIVKWQNGNNAVFCFSDIHNKYLNENIDISLEQSDNIIKRAKELNAAIIVENMGQYHGSNRNINNYILNRLSKKNELLVYLNAIKYDHIYNIEFRYAHTAASYYYNSLYDKTGDYLGYVPVSFKDQLQETDKVISEITKYNDNKILNNYYKKHLNKIIYIHNIIKSVFLNNNYSVNNLNKLINSDIIFVKKIIKQQKYQIKNLVINKLKSGYIDVSKNFYKFNNLKFIEFKDILNNIEKDFNIIKKAQNFLSKNPNYISKYINYLNIELSTQMIKYFTKQYDTRLLDLIIMHTVYLLSNNYQNIFVCAGTSHIDKISKMLPQLGYKKISNNISDNFYQHILIGGLGDTFWLVPKIISL